MCVTSFFIRCNRYGIFKVHAKTGTAITDGRSYRNLHDSIKITGQTRKIPCGYP